jgi:hypothetical protein
MRFLPALLLAFSLSWHGLCHAQAAQSSSTTQDESSSRVQSHDVPEDDDDEDETPWMLYGVISGFVVFAAVVYLVISRADRSGKG